METKYRVINTCRYDIGMKQLNGSEVNIRPGSFAQLSEDDIVYVETLCSYGDKLFSTQKLKVVDRSGNVVNVENFGVAIAEETSVHNERDEIVKKLKSNINTFKKWINEINEPEELYDIYVIAKELDLNASKLKVLSDKLPEKNMLD